MPTLEFRYATVEDAKLAAALLRDIVAPFDIYNEEARSSEIAKFSATKIATRIEADPKSVILGYANGTPCGFSITQDQHGPIWLEWYGVTLLQRRQGIGEAIVRHLINEGPTRRATKIWCDTHVSNISSMALFQKLGFHRLCTLYNHWYGQDFYLWERKI
jgi:ribosomal protein S18 acetylase RimI-like enzyme